VNTPTTSGVTIRAETEHDHAQIADVVTRAFGSTGEARLVAAIRASPEYIAALALVGVLDDTGRTGDSDGERIVGHVMISRCRLVDGASERSIVMLSPLAVDPDHQGCGIGGDLVRAAIELADDRGEPLVVLEGNPRYYSRFGFEAASVHGIELPLPDWAPTEAAQVIWLSTPDPDLRGSVVYPESFDVLGDESSEPTESR
jgi:putative acetyltransferase